MTRPDAIILILTVAIYPLLLCAALDWAARRDRRRDRSNP